MDRFSFLVKKLNEDDILDIVMEYLQEHEFSDCPRSRGIILGNPGKDLRLLCIWGNEDNSDIPSCNLNELDQNIDFNGDHSFLEKNSKFHL